MIELRRLCIDNVERFSEESVLEKFGVLARCGKRMSASDNGWGMSIDENKFLDMR
jgi:hypothetical protein